MVVLPKLSSAGIDELQLSAYKPARYVPKVNAALRDRLRVTGVIEPILVRATDERRYEILSNPSSWVAAGRLGIAEIPILIYTISDKRARELVRVSYGTPRVDPIAEAEGFAEQLEHFGGGYGAITNVARQNGLNRSYVSHALRLLNLPLFIQEWVSEGALSAGHARSLAGMSDPIRQRELVRQIIEEGLSVRAAEALARQGAQEKTPSDKPQNPPRKNPDIQRLERRVTEVTGLPFEIRGEEAVFRFFGDSDLLGGLLEKLGEREG